MAHDIKSTYYDAGGIETIEVIRAKLTPQQLEGYYLGNVIKYSSRLNFKGRAQRDAEKLARYSRWLDELLGPEQSGDLVPLDHEIGADEGEVPFHPV